MELPKRPLAPEGVTNPRIYTHLVDDKISFLGASLGPLLSSNPEFLSYSDPPPITQLGSSANLASGFRRDTSFGSIEATYSGIYDIYLSDWRGSYFQHEFDLPLKFSVGPTQYLILRPFGSYHDFRGDAYYGLLGSGLAGTLRSSEGVRHILQASVYEDHFFQDAMTNRQGLHIRFDYRLELSTPVWYARFVVYIEHNKTGRDRNPAISQSINYSHNDIALSSYARWNLGWISPGLVLQGILREDVLSSTYLNPSVSALPINRRREDFQIVFRPHATLPLSSELQLYAWVELNRNYSNMNVSGYEDDNVMNESAGVTLRYFYSGF